MAKVLVTENYLQDTANAIRAKNGLSSTYKPSQFATAIQALPTEYDINDIATRNFINKLSGAISTTTANQISSGVFYSALNLTQFDGPNVLSIYAGAFSYCYNLTSVSFPKANLIGQRAFQQCSQLTSYTCEVNIGTLYAYAFYSCINLQTFIAKSRITTIGSNVFLNCSNLNLVSVASWVNTIGSSAFRSCYRLASLYLTGVSRVPTLSAGAFYSTPMSDYTTELGQYGSIYVPSSLYSSFLTATNWSAVKNRIVSV